MKVLFSNPPWWDERIKSTDGVHYLAGVRAGSRWPFTYASRSRPDHFHYGEYLPYPFFMGYAATYLAQRTGVMVHLRDSIAVRESYNTYFDAVEAGRYDFLVLESASPSWEHDRRVIEELHRVAPWMRIILTGPITALQAADILLGLPVHACVRGEYEKGVARVIEGASGVIEHDLLTSEEMNAAPFPYFDHVIARRYVDVNPPGQQFPQAQVWSSRGCPYKCIFCVWPATMTGHDPDGTRVRRVRHYSAEYMEAFLRELVGRHEFRSIYFDDDTFNLGNAHVERMCGVMQKIGLPWSAMCRADTIGRETWALMRESGCFGVKIGFESGDQEVVDRIVNKHLDLEQARETVSWIQGLGMSVHGTFTYGLPGETREQMQRTKAYIASLALDSFQESGCAEIEGTPLATLRQMGHLEQYAGARLDDGYMVHTDGAKKMQRLATKFSRE